MPKEELAIIILFCIIFGIYVFTFLLLFVRPPLFDDVRIVKIVLFIFCLIGSFAITLKYYLDYNIIIMLVLLIVFFLCYLAGLIIVIIRAIRQHKEAERLFEELRQKKHK